jgi:hypothetical protein
MLLRQYSIIDQLGQLLAEELMRFAQSAALIATPRQPKDSAPYNLE